MKTKKSACLGVICGCLLAVSAGGQTMIEGFEYESDIDLLANWFPMSSSLTLSSYVAPGSSGTNSLRMERYFPASDWDTEVITGPGLIQPMSIAPEQYLTFRIAGDPEFVNGTYQTLFLYAWDANGNFGRWGSPVPLNTNWQIFNFRANTIAAPWDSPGLPDLSNITQFKFYLYGQGAPAGPAYSAVVHIDDVMIRDTPLVEFPPASPMRALIDDFEGYADSGALMSFYSYMNSPAATFSTATLESPAPQGNKALKLAIDFASGQYPWGSVRSAVVAPFSIPTNAVVQFRVKGDPSLASIADAGTTIWLSFYDEAGRGFNFSTDSVPVTSSDWMTLKVAYNQFWSNTPVDTGNLVRWRILTEGWMGTPDSQATSGTFYFDDIRVTVPPVLEVYTEGSALKLRLKDLIPGTTYTLMRTENFSGWTTAATIQANSSTETWTIPGGQQAGFYQLSYTP
jgi:hypothetical protein